MINVSDNSNTGLKALFAKREAREEAQLLPQIPHNPLFARRKSRKGSTAEDSRHLETAEQNMLIESLMVINHP